MTTKKKILKWVNMTAFGLLLLGGLDFLLMGLFKFELFGSMFSGTESTAARVFYSLFGISAAWLLGVILYRAFVVKPMAKKPATKKASA